MIDLRYFIGLLPSVIQWVLAAVGAICTTIALGAAPVCAQQTPSGLSDTPQGLPTAQTNPGNQQGWTPDIQNPFNTTVVPRSSSPAPNQTGPASAGVKLQAYITETSPRMILDGIVWRIYRIGGGIENKPKLVATRKQPAPNLKLPAGIYIVNASLGRASLSRKVIIKRGAVVLERFVLNAGGLRVLATLANGKSILPHAVNYDIYSDERNQFGARTLILGNMKPGVVIRLNAGIYHIVSTYGDANAQVRSDVTVEAGKLTVAQVAHLAARVTLKLVLQSGGDALADTKWRLVNSKGVIIKESVGAIPTHTIAAGDYTVSAHHGNRIYKATFSVAPDEDTQIEVIMQ